MSYSLLPVSRRSARVLAMVMLTTGAVLASSSPSVAATDSSISTSTSAAHATVVVLRVEGATSTIFEAPVLTTGHDITTESGGTHHCDGTNNGANPTPGPTATSALDDGSHIGGFTWDGTYWAEFDDFFITRIAGDAQTTTQFWGILLNGELTPVGGCQQAVRLGDEVLFAFDAFSKSHVLTLTGPRVTRVGRPTTYHVADAQTGAPIAGADVHGSTSDANGNATLTFSSAGLVKVKADRADAIRSKAVLTIVAP